MDQDTWRRLSDHEAIRRLLVDYGRHLDARDFAAYAALFATDGEWVGGFGTLQGREMIRTQLQQRLGEVSSAGAHHLVTEPAIDVDPVDRDAATAWSRWLFLTPGSSGTPTIVMSGQYDDVLIREEGFWRFRRRVVVTDAMAAPGEHS